MIYLQGLAVVVLIVLWSQVADVKTMIGWVFGGLVGIGLVIAVMAFTNEMSRSHFNKIDLSHPDYIEIHVDGVCEQNC